MDPGHIGTPELAVVIPVYNEEEAIASVLAKWSETLEGLGIDFRIHAYNDGSEDGTGALLDDLARANTRLVVHHKQNSGHGPTILQGYRDNCDGEWLFQIDSDDEMGPEAFGELWSHRETCDFLIGERVREGQPAVRQFISWAASLTVRLLFGDRITDVNTPYRLMRCYELRGLLQTLPDDLFAPNTIISGLASAAGLRIYRTRVRHRPRQTGEVSLRRLKLLSAATRCFLQTVRYRSVYRKGKRRSRDA
jgi:glycosyltransferase involved in cell wall biosynthesis